MIIEKKEVFCVELVVVIGLNKVFVLDIIKKFFDDQLIVEICVGDVFIVGGRKLIMLIFNF